MIIDDYMPDMIICLVPYFNMIICDAWYLSGWSKPVFHAATWVFELHTETEGNGMRGKFRKIWWWWRWRWGGGGGAVCGFPSTSFLACLLCSECSWVFQHTLFPEHQVLLLKSCLLLVRSPVVVQTPDSLESPWSKAGDCHWKMINSSSIVFLTYPLVI